MQLDSIGSIETLMLSWGDRLVDKGFKVNQTRPPVCGERRRNTQKLLSPIQGWGIYNDAQQSSNSAFNIVAHFYYFIANRLIA